MEELIENTALTELKGKINKSIKELVRMNLALINRVKALEDRIADYNRRAGHKI